MTEPAGPKTIGKCRRPGFLLEPLGWVQDQLIKAIEDEPNLIDLVFGLDQPRMHLVALALAHMTSDVTSDVAAILLAHFSDCERRFQAMVSAHFV